MVTKEQILKIMPNARTRIETFLQYINRYMADFEINTPLRKAHFLAQIAHESAELRYTEEIASGAAYEGRKDLGNVKPGDGKKYKGRGLIQLTGRANYQKYKEFCGYDVISSPELLAKPLGATRSACWFWKTRGLNALADLDDLRGITRKINGGYNGLASRTMYLARAKQVIK